MIFDSIHNINAGFAARSARRRALTRPPTFEQLTLLEIKHLGETIEFGARGYGHETIHDTEREHDEV